MAFSFRFCGEMNSAALSHTNLSHVKTYFCSLGFGRRRVSVADENLEFLEAGEMARQQRRDAILDLQGPPGIFAQAGRLVDGFWPLVG